MNTADETLQAHAAQLWDQGRRAEAIETFTALQAHQPDNIDLALRLGIALMQVGRMVEAVRLMEPLAARAGHAHPVHDWLGRALATVLWHEYGPDAIAGGTWEAFERVLRQAGYFGGGLPKIEVAREMAKHMDPARNTSASFGQFVQGLATL